MDKLIFTCRRRKVGSETVRLSPEALALVSEIAEKTGCSQRTIASSMVMFCKDKIQLIDSCDVLINSEEEM